MKERRRRPEALICFRPNGPTAPARSSELLPSRLPRPTIELASVAMITTSPGRARPMAAAIEAKYASHSSLGAVEIGAYPEMKSKPSGCALLLMRAPVSLTHNRTATTRGPRST
eukprot:6399418-Prymnesium_polylepis.1